VLRHTDSAIHRDRFSQQQASLVSIAKAEEFVLTEPGTPGTVDHQPNWGYGWFRISSPAAGWVYSKYLNGVGGIYSADCSDHEGLESP
jgi:hypothetical protein